MPEKITWNFQARVTLGPQISAAGSFDVEAYDKLAIEIPAGADQQVDLVPGGGQVSLIVLSPATASADLTYEVDGKTVPLDSTQVFLGAGAATLLGADPASLTFSNGTDAPVVIEILVGRDATPTPTPPPTP